MHDFLIINEVRYAEPNEREMLRNKSVQIRYSENLHS